jgi:hypothetical protein
MGTLRKSGVSVAFTDEKVVSYPCVPSSQGRTIMKNLIKINCKIAGTVLAAVLVFTLTTCGTTGGGIVSQAFTSIDDLEEYLYEQPANTPSTPYLVKLNVADITNLEIALNNAADKYVYLDLSGSTITSIPNSAFNNSKFFYGCASLTGVFIPTSVTNIERGAFYGYTSLTAINVSTGNSAYIAENGVLYNRNKTVIYTYPAGKTGSLPYLT